jgi:excisionase family DNA binding protein
LTGCGELVRKKEFDQAQPEDRLHGGFMTEREEELLNSRQVAVILDLSPDTVNEFARKNILPAFKKGKQWRFRKRDISLFYRKQTRDIRDA